MLLVEPSVPARHQPRSVRARAFLRSFISSGSRPKSRIGRRDSETDRDQHIDRWEIMSGHYRKNVNAARLAALGRPFGLVGTEAYLARFGRSWRKIEPAGINVYVLVNATGHLDCFDGSSADQLAAFLREWHSS
jgi:hypothetical protein